MTYLNNLGKTPDGELEVIPIGGQVVTTTETLDIGEVWESDWLTINGYNALLYAVQSDVPSAERGVLIQYSQDGVNVSSMGQGRTYETNPTLFQAALVPKGLYVRFRYVNGSTAQTTFSFEVRFFTGPVQQTLTSLNSKVSPTNLAAVSASILFGPDGTGTYVPLDLRGVAQDTTLREVRDALLSNEGLDLSQLATHDDIDKVVTAIEVKEYPSFPTSIEVSNLNDLPAPVVNVELPEQPAPIVNVEQNVIEFPEIQMVEVINQPLIPTSISVNNLPAQQHVIVDNQPNPITQIAVNNFPTVQHVVVDNPTQPTDTSTLATAAKQLPNNHQVTVSNPVTSVTVSGEVELKNDSGNPIPVTVTNPNSSVNVTNFPSTQNVVVTSVPDVEIKNDPGNPIPVSLQGTPTVIIDSKPYIWQQIEAGKGFMWSTGVLTVTAALSNLRMMIDNPANSGKTLYIYSVIADNANDIEAYAAFIVNPTGNLPTTLRSSGANQKIGTAGASGISVYADAAGSAITGGVTAAQIFTPANSRTEYIDESIFILPAGNKLAINAPYLLQLTSTQTQVVIHGIVI